MGTKTVRKLSRNSNSNSLEYAQLLITECDFVLSKQFTYLLEIFSISIDWIWIKGMIGVGVLWWHCWVSGIDWSASDQLIRHRESPCHINSELIFNFSETSEFLVNTFHSALQIWKYTFQSSSKWQNGLMKVELIFLYNIWSIKCSLMKLSSCWESLWPPFGPPHSTITCAHCCWFLLLPLSISKHRNPIFPPRTIDICGDQEEDHINRRKRW